MSILIACMDKNGIGHLGIVPDAKMGMFSLTGRLSSACGQFLDGVTLLSSAEPSAPRLQCLLCDNFHREFPNVPVHVVEEAAPSETARLLSMVDRLILSPPPAQSAARPDSRFERFLGSERAPMPGTDTNFSQEEGRAADTHSKSTFEPGPLFPPADWTL